MNINMETEIKKQELKKPRKTIKKSSLEKTSEKTEKTKIVETKYSETGHNLMAVVRIAGQVKVKEDIKNTLDRLRLRRKYVCVLINSKNESLMGMLNRVKYHVAFGDIERDTLVELLKARGKRIVGVSSVSKTENSKFAAKINYEESAEEIINGKNLEELGFKPFFRLHPPRKGIKSKLQYPRGVLGNNKKDINKLIMRML